MSEYQLEIRQLVDYPRCRIYREFVQTLIADRNIRTNGGSGLFYYTVLCSYANFRTSYRRLDGISYTIYPGEWVCRISELAAWFRVGLRRKVLAILKSLQERHLITFTQLGHGNLIKYSIKGWRKHNTVLDYNCPCQKESGFFFMPISIATELISFGKASEMDIVLDLWLSAIYKDNQVMGSDAGPVVYLRNGTGNPLLNYTDLSQRWGISRSTVGRILKKLAALDYLTLMTFPGRTGSVIYLNNYLSTMFQVSDVMVDKDEVAMSLNIKLHLQEDTGTLDANTDSPNICVSDQLSSVSKPQAENIVRKVAQVLETQGIACLKCPKSTYKLYPLSGDCKVVGMGGGQPEMKFGMAILCGNSHTIYRFELTMTLTETDF
ncbi:MAG: transposase family protein [Oscillibacter sp.]|nr:transposase family protein [Oscillibacter sp.]